MNRRVSILVTGFYHQDMRTPWQRHFADNPPLTDEQWERKYRDKLRTNKTESRRLAKGALS